MNQLILTINALQNFNRKYNLTHIQLPEIIVIGSQSSGKSSVLERIIKRDILPKGNKIATRCPIIIQMINKNILPKCKSNCDESNDDNDSFTNANDAVDFDDLKAIFNDDPNDPQYGAEKIAQKLQQMTNRIGKTITDVPIILSLYGSSIPTLTLVDVPGSIQNEEDLFDGAKDMIQNMIMEFVKKPYSIILAVSSANNDLANSDSIRFAKNYDPTGCRTINVLTKIDMMDQGTSMRDLLSSRFVARSLKTVCVVNRSQQNVANKQQIEIANELEREFFRKNYADIASEHGIDYLIICLVKKLKEQILVYLPEMKNEISETIQEKKEKLQILDVTKDETVLKKSIVKFVSEYKNLIRGDRYYYDDNIVGGALISNVLYKIFRDQVDAMKPNHFTRNLLHMTIINTCGNRKISYGIEKTFVAIIRKEIHYFEDPSLKCLNRVRDLLQEFVLDILNELNINELEFFVRKLESEMLEFIDKRYKDTREVIKNLIRSETNDVFCAHPNSHFYESFKANLYKKKTERKRTIFSDIIDNLPGVISNIIPPQVATLLKVADSTGMINPLKELLVEPANFHMDQLQNIIGPENMPNINVDGVGDFIRTNNLIGTIDEVSAEAKMKINSTDFNAELDVDALESMIIQYFDQVRQNIIYSVPKWIQTLLIDDLLEHITFALYPFFDENPSEWMKINPELEEKIKTLKNEVQDLNDILHSLWELNRA